MRAATAVKTARMRTAPKDAETSLRSLTPANRLYRSEGSMQPTLTPLDPDQFWMSVHKTSTCWLWTGRTNHDGYGSCGVREGAGIGRTQRVHRIAWELVIGPIPVEKVLDHLCRVRHCVNPEHLRVVDSKTNTLAGIGPTAINARKLVCGEGHPLTGDNLYICPRGRRNCRECKKARTRESRMKQRQCPVCGEPKSVSWLATHIRTQHAAYRTTEPTEGESE